MSNSAKLLALTILASTLGLSACQPKADPEPEKPEASAVETAKLPSLEGEIVKLQLALPECEGHSCPEISIERLQSNQPFIDRVIDQGILKQLQQTLDLAPQDQQVASEPTSAIAASATVAEASVPATPQQNLETQVQPYLRTFLQMDQELKQLGASHSINLMIKPKILIAQSPVATVVMNSSSYLGGAHGAAAQQYYNFDLKQQRQLQLQDILQPNQRAALRQEAHRVFQRWVVDSKLATSVEEYEQVWPFQLSDNFFLSQQGLILQYGEYEIGPYVVGLPRLVVPYEKLQKILKPQYLPQAAKAADQKAAS
ncbi:RsiV family protein [Acinetobacter sp. GSS19]|uniref:RsiV family protein n=1 Tax=Acinetobacter sp. GSS19 TaxID=3020716 RepID=UPI00235E461C|nr:RsiV family protein [Acinetobacter sp. GSS19]